MGTVAGGCKRETETTTGNSVDVVCEMHASVKENVYIGYLNVHKEILITLAKFCHIVCNSIAG